MGFRRIVCEDTEFIQLAFVRLYKLGNEPKGAKKRALFRTFLERGLLFLVCKVVVEWEALLCLWEILFFLNPIIITKRKHLDIKLRNLYWLKSVIPR
jgi:hypothetical protein